MAAAGDLLQQRYRIVRRVAQSSASALYHAQDVATGANVALKMAKTAAPALQRRLAHEAELLANLSHPSLPAFHQFFVTDDAAYLVMDYVPGDDLAQQMAQRRTPFAPATVLTWVTDLLDALDYLHRQQPPIIHGDIKPHNLKLAADGRAMLLDLGVAGRAAQTATGYSLVYAAPEQLDSAMLQPACDLYSLAATLYDLLTGVKPIDARQRQAALAVGADDPLLPAQVWAPALPTDLCELLVQGLALQPTARFASAAAMRAALEACRVALETATADGEPVQHADELIGRAPHLREARRLLLQPGVRVLTITGPGGVGKTTLALALAQQVQVAFADGVSLVELASLHAATEVAAATAHALGLVENDETETGEQICQVLTSQQRLLVLDNFEHLLGAAAEVADWLRLCPRLKLLITSRAALQIEGEAVYELAPLAVPAAGCAASAVLAAPATALFIQRGRLAQPALCVNDVNASLIAAIVVALDGLPLAIELAAAQLRTQTLDALASQLSQGTRLHDESDATALSWQRSLHNALEGSFARLTPREQQLFMRLACFVGGFTTTAVQSICCDVQEDKLPLLDLNAAAALEKLAAHSLIRRREALRYTMLETVRHYAASWLSQADADLLQRRHARYFLQWIEARNDSAANSESWLEQVEAERANLQKALAWSMAAENAETALRLAASLWRFWEVRGEYRSGLASLNAALALEGGASLARWRAQALAGAGALARNLSRYAEAGAYFRMALTLCREEQESQGIANALNSLGTLAYYQNDLDGATAYYQEALTLRRVLNDRRGIAGALNNLAMIDELKGAYARARKTYREALSIFRELDDAVNSAYTLGNLGIVAEHEGDLAQAVQLFQESLGIQEQLGDRWGAAAALANLGSTLDRLGQREEAQALLAESVTIFYELGDLSSLANTLGALARNASHRRAYTDAARYLGAAERLQAQLETPLPSQEAAERRRITAAVRAALGEAAYTRAWSAGAAVELSSLLAQIEP
jgi:predicted ATPase